MTYKKDQRSINFGHMNQYLFDEYAIQQIKVGHA